MTAVYPYSMNEVYGNAKFKDGKFIAEDYVNTPQGQNDAEMGSNPMMGALIPPAQDAGNPGQAMPQGAMQPQPGQMPMQPGQMQPPTPQTPTYPENAQLLRRRP